MKRNLLFFIRQPGHPLDSLCIRITERWLVNQVGNGKANWECGWFLTLPERSAFQKTEMTENLGKNVNQQRKKEKCCSFCGKRGFSLLPNSTSAGNPIQRAAGISKNLKN